MLLSDLNSLLILNNIRILLYIIVYNYSLIVLFSLLSGSVLNNYKNINSLNLLGTSSFSLLASTIIIMSLAGVPPLLGFFTKIFILIIILNSNLLLLFSFLLILLLSSLFFYVQNIRYLHSSKTSLENKINKTTHNTFLNYYSVEFSILILSLLVLGLLFVDNLLILTLWLII